MIKDEIRSEKILSEEQRQLISSNMGLLRVFYQKEIDKGYIPDQKEDEFLSYLQRGFCNSALNYDKSTGFKFSTYVYGGFNFCVEDIKNSILKDEKISNVGVEEFLINDGIYEDKSIWNSISGWDADFSISHEKIVATINEVPLSERERVAIDCHYLEGITFSELGKKMGISGERVRQIELNAITKIKTFINKKDYRIEDFIKNK